MASFDIQPRHSTSFTPDITSKLPEGYPVGVENVSPISSKTSTTTSNVDQVEEDDILKMMAEMETNPIVKIKKTKAPPKKSLKGVPFTDWSQVKLVVTEPKRPKRKPKPKTPSEVSEVSDTSSQVSAISSRSTRSRRSSASQVSTLESPSFWDKYKMPIVLTGCGLLALYGISVSVAAAQQNQRRN